MDTQFYVGLAIGFFLSLLSNFISSWWNARRAVFATHELYKGIEGDYLAYSQSGNEINFGDQLGECRITHQGGDVLKIHYKEIKADCIWEAEVWMVSPFSGSMVYRYVLLSGEVPTSTNNFGFKRCAVFDRPGRDGAIRKFFCLWGESDYGKEALEKK